jgi:hypothetical protein
LETTDVERKRAAEGETRTAVHSDDRTSATLVPTEKSPGVEAQGGGAAGAQTPVKAMPSDLIAPPALAPKSDQALPTKGSLLSPVADETGSTIDGAGDPVATRVARTISDVRMRAGPSNGQAVVAAIPGGSALEVIKCRAWCEVVFAGQRGWVYKGFIGTEASSVHK